jgi:putative nucleotidyltransferase with HDIG domain
MSKSNAATDLERLLESLGDLPSSPAIVSAVIGMASDLNTNLTELGKVLSADQGLTAKVLRLSNSSFYGRSKQIGTIDEAIMTLGYYTLRSLVVASSTHSIFKQKDITRFLPVLWDHSLAAAVSARLLGRQLRHPQTEEAFIGGLLHDVGKLVLMQKLPEPYSAVREAAMADGRWCAHEKEALGFTHVDVGVAVLELWNLPRELVEAVALHHQQMHVAADRPTSLAQLIWLSNLVAHGTASPWKETSTQNWEQNFRQANIHWPADKVAAFFDAFQEQLSQERWLFSEGS